MAKHDKKQNTLITEVNAILDEAFAAVYACKDPEEAKRIEKEAKAEIAHKVGNVQSLNAKQGKTICKQAEENKHLRETVTKQNSQLRYLDHWKTKAGLFQKKLWATQNLVSDLTMYINNLESKKKTGKIEKSLRAEISALIKKIEELNNEIREQGHELIKLEQINSEVVDYADAQITKLKAEMQKKTEMFAAWVNELEEKINTVTTRAALLAAENKDLSKKVTYYEKKQQMNFKTSSKPSSQDENHPVPSNRKKTGRKKGAQGGHSPHPRRMQENPTETNFIPTPDYILNDPKRYHATGTKSVRQMADIFMIPVAVQYEADNYLDVKTGRIVHAEFPKEVKDDFNYGASVKALAFILNNKCNVSVGNVQQFIFEATGHKICPSQGFISQLTKEFAAKTNDDADAILKELKSSYYCNADFTYGRLDKKLGTVLIVTNGDKVMFMDRPGRGLAGIIDTFLPDYEGIVVSDHESVLKNLGRSGHQECLAHVIRYLLATTLFDEDLTWPGRMLQWVYDGIDYWQEASKTQPDESKVSRFETEYDEIIKLAAKEYEEKGIENCYRKGYNCYKRMSEVKENYTLFLHDLTIPPTNNAAEINARKFKRKCHQVMTFRSDRGFKDFLRALTIIESLKADGADLFESISDIFSREKPPKSADTACSDPK